MTAYYSSVVQPSGYIIHSPVEFSKWVEWAQRQEPGKQELKMEFGLGKTELARTMDDFLGRI